MSNALSRTADLHEQEPLCNRLGNSIDQSCWLELGALERTLETKIWDDLLVSASSLPGSELNELGSPSIEVTRVVGSILQKPFTSKIASSSYAQQHLIIMGKESFLCLAPDTAAPPSNGYVT